MQFEGQLTHTRASPETGAELLIRWAPLSRLELRLGTPSYVDTDFGAGFSDPSVGAKLQLGPVGAWDIAALAAVSLPVSDAFFSTGTVDPELLVAATRAMAGVGLAAQAAVTRDNEADLWLVGGTLGLHVPLSDRWNGYAELDAVAATAYDLALLPHAGVTYALTPDVHLDAHTGIGATASAPDVLLGFGLTVLR